MADAGIGSTERAERGAYNQALFRAINERINDDPWDVEPGAHDPDIAVDQWICECANVVCFERIALSAVEYRRVREVAWRFAVAPGDLHVFPDIETVTDRQQRYWTVDKTGHARTIAIDLGPRRGEG